MVSLVITLCFHVVKSQVFVLLECSYIFFDLHLRIGVRSVNVLQGETSCLILFKMSVLTIMGFVELVMQTNRFTCR